MSQRETLYRTLGISSKEQLARFELIQPMYNLVKRQAKVEIFQWRSLNKLGSLHTVRLVPVY